MLCRQHTGVARCTVGCNGYNGCAGPSRCTFNALMCTFKPSIETHPKNFKLKPNPNIDND